jgi:hypothetical protein
MTEENAIKVEETLDHEGLTKKQYLTKTCWCKKFAQKHLVRGIKRDRMKYTGGCLSPEYLKFCKAWKSYQQAIRQRRPGAYMQTCLFIENSLGPWLLQTYQEDAVWQLNRAEDVLNHEVENNLLLQESYQALKDSRNKNLWITKRVDKARQSHRLALKAYLQVENGANNIAPLLQEIVKEAEKEAEAIIA